MAQVNSFRLKRLMFYPIRFFILFLPKFEFCYMPLFPGVCFFIHFRSVNHGWMKYANALNGYSDFEKVKYWKGVNRFECLRPVQIYGAVCLKTL